MNEEKRKTIKMQNDIKWNISCLYLLLYVNIAYSCWLFVYLHITNRSRKKWSIQKDLKKNSQKPLELRILE